MAKKAIMALMAIIEGSTKQFGYRKQKTFQSTTVPDDARWSKDDPVLTKTMKNLVATVMR